MFDPSEIPETKSKFALHVVRHDREIIIQKIPLLEVTDDTIGENILEPFIEPVGNHHAYLVNGRLKVSRKFPKAITDTKHRKNNIHLYFEFTSSRFTKNFNFQIVPIWHSVRWAINFFQQNHRPIEFIIYHPTRGKECLAGMVHYRNTKITKSIARFIENIAYE